MRTERSGQLHWIWALAMVAGVGMTEARGAIVYVKADAPGYNVGTSWEFAFTNLQQALEFSQPGDELWVARGTYRPLDSGPNYAVFEIRGERSVYGGFAGFETARDQRNWKTNLTVLRGNPGIYAPIVFMRGEDLRIDGVVITGALNQSPAGGAQDPGALNARGGVVVANCRIEGNTGFRVGGAMVMGSPGDFDMVVTNCVFVGNHAVYGHPGGTSLLDPGAGGLRALNARIVDCEFYLNRVTTIYPEVHGASGLVAMDSEVINCVVYDNTEFSGSLPLGEVGKGVFITGSDSRPARLINSTVVANAGSDAYFSGVVEIANSIIWGTHSPVTNTISARYSTFPTLVEGPGNSSAPPQFVDPIQKNFRLLPGSPGINDGDNAALPEWLLRDRDGELRVIDGNKDGSRIVDRGAFESGDWAAFFSIRRDSSTSVELSFGGRTPQGIFLDRKLNEQAWVELGWYPPDSDAGTFTDPIQAEATRVFYRLRLP